MTTRRWPRAVGGTADALIACTRSAERIATGSAGLAERFHRGYRLRIEPGSSTSSKPSIHGSDGRGDANRAWKSVTSSDGSRPASAGTRFRM